MVSKGVFDLAGGGRDGSDGHPSEFISVPRMPSRTMLQRSFLARQVLSRVLQLWRYFTSDKLQVRWNPIWEFPRS